jgi:glutamate-1-semialdehyde 2,1-aminomutase
LEGAYRSKTRRSESLFQRGKKVFAGGVNHNARFYEPYPIFVKKARGQHIWDEDGNKLTDYWMGHMALILGHSPKVVVDALREQVGNGTHYGMGSELSVELGEEVQKAVPCAERMRFCNTGAEATMYLVRLARAFTGKRVVIKMAGGWHGYNTELNKGVHTPFDRADSAGILEEEQAHIRNVRFNDFGAAESEIKGAHGDAAAIFLEPVLGAGGCIPADRDYLKGLRELADAHGVLLCFDEIITGFRLAIGGAQEWYGVKPDLATFGKIAGGGLPIGMVCGSKEIISLADPAKKSKRSVSIGGGTFSENPLTMAAGLATVRHLRKNPAIYPRLEKMGKITRREIDKVFADARVEVHTSGAGSLFLSHFGKEPRSAEDTAGDDEKMSSGYALYLMTSGNFILPGHPSAISTAHSSEDIRGLVNQTAKFAESVKKRK